MVFMFKEMIQDDSRYQEEDEGEGPKTGGWMDWKKPYNGFKPAGFGYRLSKSNRRRSGTKE